MAQHPVTDLLELWPSRGAVLEDARRVEADLDLVAVHRWFQRSSVPPKYWRGLIIGAQARGLEVSADAFVTAHAAPLSVPDDLVAPEPVVQRGAA